MNVLETRVYRGPNLYARWPVIRLRVDLGELEDYPTRRLPGFADRLVALLPTLAEHTCSYREPGGFVRRMTEDEGTWLGHVLEHVAIELQCLAGHRVAFGKTRREGLPRGQYHVVYSYRDESVGRAAGELGLALVRHLLPPRRLAHDPAAFDLAARLGELRALAERRAFGPSTAALVRAAEERGIPWLRLDDDSLLQLGHGRWQRRIRATVTSCTPVPAVEIAGDKSLCHRLLAAAGIPVPRQEVVAGAEESCEPGADYRILVVDGRTVAVAERVPGRTDDLSAGGTAIDRTDDIHPDNRRLAERAARTVGLDVAGVDFLSPDIARSHREIGGAVVEVNASPGLRMHLAPSLGMPRDVARPILELLFPRGRPATLPIAALTGTNGKTTTTRMVAHILTLAGYIVGMTTTDGVYLGGELAAAGDFTGPRGAAMVLRDATVDAAVLETARGGLLRSGLGFPSCNVGAVLNVAADHLGLDGVADLDDLARVKQIVAEVAKDVCVLNAEDERTARMARATRAATVVYVSLDPEHERVRRHLRRGGRALVLAPGPVGGRLVVRDGAEEIPLVEIRRIPSALGGHALHNVQNALFAAAVAHGLGVSWEAVRRGLATFAQDYERAPGRLNLFDLPGVRPTFRALLDYAHNVPALAATARMVRSLPDPGRRIGVLAAPGDRRDEDIRTLGQEAARAFDLVLLRDDDDRRGRAPGEVPALLQEGLLRAGVAPERILVCTGREGDVVDQALELAEPGDLVVLLATDLDLCHGRIAAFAGRTRSAPAEPALAAR
jgi:UDP-N-acetylmuramyl tripeptide synthase